MKLLVINSNAIFKKENEFLIDNSIGKFLVELKELNYEIDFFHFLLESSESDFNANFNIIGKGITITTIKRQNIKLIAYAIAYLKGIIRITQNEFLYLFYPNSFYFLCLFASFMNKPFGLYIRGEKGIESKISKFIFRRAKFVTTVSPMFTETVISYGVEAHTIAPMMNYYLSDVDYKRNYVAKNKYRLLIVGRTEIDKGLFELIRSIKDLVECGHKNIVLDIVGEGPHFQKAKKEVSDLDLDNYITFYGAIYNKDKLRSFYSSSDIFILPSYHEGFPRVLYEAMIFGTPILTTFVGSISHIMKDKYNCFRLEPHNANSITALLKAFINNYEEMSVIAKNATNTVVDYLQRHNLKHEEIINSMLKQIYY